jgi:hypothetical protein
MYAEPPIRGRGLIAARRVRGELNWLIWARKATASPGRSVVRAVDRLLDNRLLDNGVENHDADSGQDGVPVEAFWESFRLDPRQPGHASMRASDADREIVRAMLADAYADGRLTREEYDDRLNTLYGSRTLGEVAYLLPPGAPILSA